MAVGRTREDNTQIVDYVVPARSAFTAHAEATHTHTHIRTEDTCYGVEAAGVNCVAIDFLSCVVPFLHASVSICFGAPSPTEGNKEKAEAESLPHLKTLIMRFTAAADDLVISPCRLLLSKLGGSGASSCSQADAVVHHTNGRVSSSSPTLMQTSHAFSARLDDGGPDSTSCGCWDVAMRLVSMGPSPPSMLVGFGPQGVKAQKPTTTPAEVHIHSLGGGELAQEGGVRETQDMFERRVLTTPLVWEEPGFVFLECSDKPVRMWSDTMELYGAPPSALNKAAPSQHDDRSCFIFSKEHQRWIADVRVSWFGEAGRRDAACGGHAAQPEGGEFSFYVAANPSSSVTEKQQWSCSHASSGPTCEIGAEKREAPPPLWTKVAAGAYKAPAELWDEFEGSVTPYVTLLQHCPCEVRLLH